ncbi:unnamed protein product [Coregonus sp. 'balchen']|nr:unnamed protein product [Coregonus sp. 'balchen']
MDDERVGTFVSLDYVVFACLFVVSSGIGVFFAVKERKNPSSEFLVGGRQMTFGPVALSLTASFMSAVTVLGAPSDVYRFGGSFILFGVAYTFVVIATAELFVPVFYRSGITSTYEYLEMRFCKGVRMAATLIYIVQTLMPYFVMEILGEYPGLPGLFVACAFSGTLSTVAASINALATVTYEDFVKQCCTNLSNKASGWISKGLCIVFGIACTTMAVAASYMGGIVQAALSIHGHTRSQDVKPWLLRPVCNLFCFWSKKYKKMCWCGVNHELKQDMEDPDTDTVKDEGPFVKEDTGRNGTKRKVQPAQNCYNLQEKVYDNAGFTEDTQPF